MKFSDPGAPEVRRRAEGIGAAHEALGAPGLTHEAIGAHFAADVANGWTTHRIMLAYLHGRAVRRFQILKRRNRMIRFP